LAAVKLRRRGLTLDEINETLDTKISNDSLLQWLRLYEQTRDVVRDPALYLQRGRPLSISREGAAFILDALEADPSLYIDEIQSHIKVMTGVIHPASTIKLELKARLLLTKKKARTVHPAQCPIERAEYSSRVGPIRSNHFVFIGMYN
jgi:hypothetical protein